MGYSDSNDGDVSGNQGSQDVWVVKLNAAGAIQWQKSLGSNVVDYGYSIQTISGGYILAGSSKSGGTHGDLDYWIVKLNQTGAILWQKFLGGSAAEEPFSIRPTPDGGYIVAGYSLSNDYNVSGNHGDMDYWVVKLNTTGVIQWQKSLGGSGTDWAYSIQPTNGGGYVVAGFSRSDDGDVSGNHGGADAWIVKLDLNGAIQWQKSLGGSGDDSAGDVQVTSDGGYIVAGSSKSNDGDVSGNLGNSDVWVVKLDATGAIQWQKLLGGSSSEGSGSIQSTGDGGYILSGSTSSQNGDVSGHHGFTDYWVVKLNPVTGVEDHLSAAAWQVFPNPTTAVVDIQLDENESSANITITDVFGRQLQKQIIGNKGRLDMANLPAGVYILTVLTQNGKTGQKKIIKR